MVKKMSKYETAEEHLMELELNDKVFKKDPLKKNINSRLGK